MFAVCAGERLKVPHAPALPQFAVQFTPSVPGEADAASVTLAPVFNFAGGAVDIATPTGEFVTTVALAEDDLVGSVVDLAVIAIVPPKGTVELF